MIGLFWGLFSGDLQTSLYISIFFELFWLDLIPAGTFIPPHLAACTFSALALTTWFQISNPSQIMIILFASMPLAWFGAQLEGMMRNRQRRYYNKILNWARKPMDPNVPGMIILRSILVMGAVSWIFFFLTILVFQQAFAILFNDFPHLILPLKIHWSHLWIAATLGGIMALRVKRAYVILTAGIGFVLFFSIWSVFTWQP